MCVQSASDQKTERSVAVIVSFASDSGQSRAVLDRQERVELSHSLRSLPLIDIKT
jgi:hypothetical protein